MEVICALLGVYFIVLLVRIVLSWFPIDPDGFVATIHGFLHLVTEPLLGPLRRVLPPVRIGSVGLDLSPIVVIFGLSIIRNILCG